MIKDFNLNFVIFSPFPEYVSYIGGATVPHTLANQLAQFGENVYIYSNSTNPKYKINCIPWGTNIEFDPRNTIVIMIAGSGEHTFEHNIPECLLNAPNVVRWLINDQAKYYPDGDRFYTYHKYWNVLEHQQIHGELSTIEIDHEIFKNQHLPRKGGCYLMKGNLNPTEEYARICHKPDDLCIDSVLYDIPNEEKMKFYSNLFNQKEYFISYTPFTFTSVLALLCGCKSIVIPKLEYGGKAFNKEKWLNEIWCAKYGIAIGLDDLPRAISTMDQAIDNIKYYEEVTQPTQIQQFIEDCYLWLTKKYNL